MLYVTTQSNPKDKQFNWRSPIRLPLQSPIWAPHLICRMKYWQVVTENNLTMYQLGMTDPKFKTDKNCQVVRSILHFCFLPHKQFVQMNPLILRSFFSMNFYSHILPTTWNVSYFSDSRVPFFSLLELFSRINQVYFWYAFMLWKSFPLKSSIYLVYFRVQLCI